MKANMKDLNKWYNNLEAYKQFVQEHDCYVSDNADAEHIPLRTWLTYQKRYLNKGTLDTTLKAVLDTELPYWLVSVREATLTIRLNKSKEIQEFKTAYPMFDEYIDAFVLKQKCTLNDIYNIYSKPTEDLKDRVRTFSISKNQRDTPEDKIKLFLLHILTYKTGKVTEITTDMLRVVNKLTTLVATDGSVGYVNIENIPAFFSLLPNVLSEEELRIINDIYVNNSILKEVSIQKNDGSSYTRERVRQLLNIALDKLIPLFRALIYTVKDEIAAPIPALTASIATKQLKAEVFYAVPLSYFQFSAKTIRFLEEHNLKTLGDLATITTGINSKVRNKYTVLDELLIFLHGIHRYMGTWDVIYADVLTSKTQEYYVTNIKHNAEELDTRAEYVSTILNAVVGKLDSIRVLNCATLVSA